MAAPLAPDALQAAYEEVISRFVIVVMRARASHAADLDLLIEAQTRLEHLLYALTRFRIIESAERFRAPLASNLPYARITKRSLGAPELEFYAEAFYYFAGRLQDVLQRTERFKSFEAVGVRRVRNRLIEHADKSRGVMNRNYTYDAPEGFFIKEFGKGTEDARITFDKGLYPNASEVVHRLLGLTDDVKRTKTP